MRMSSVVFQDKFPERVEGGCRKGEVDGWGRRRMKEGEGRTRNDGRSVGGGGEGGNKREKRASQYRS